MRPAPLALWLLLTGALASPALGNDEQPPDATVSQGTPDAAMRVPLTVTWLADFLIHPGLRVGSTLPLLEAYGHALVVEPGLGVAWHPGHSFGVLVEALAGYRYTTPFGLYGEALVGLGYLHQLVDGAVYERGEDGVAREALNLGRPTGIASLALSAGWDLAQNGGPPLRLFVRPRVAVQGPHDGGVLPRLIGEAGLTWSF